MGHLNKEIEMNKVFAVIDANSAYWTPEGDSDYERATFVMAGSPAEACAKAREAGFDGLLVASQQQSADAAFSAAWEAARTNGGRGSFMHVTDEAGAPSRRRTPRPEEYAGTGEFARLLKRRCAALNAGAITS
ncbi:MAG: hypothetical protein IPK44_24890 [Candidatus Accumulibacter sp.]|uniref:hypothetical protein n=1 Tax=Accumulibacter sp. TaxID=2053492 RepID=UPI002582972F|nr:hypothetical protein [Accumulibacter sp.]MBK8117527.1 hypothetical protein [Accumulibacter sp.]